MEHNEAIECLRQHVREFVELEVNARLDEYLHKMDRNGQLKFNDWDGVHLSLPAPSPPRFWKRPPSGSSGHSSDPSTCAKLTPCAGSCDPPTQDAHRG